MEFSARSPRVGLSRRSWDYSDSRGCGALPGWDCREGRGTIATVEAAGFSPGGTVAKVEGLSRWPRLRGSLRVGLSRRSWDFREGRGCGVLPGWDCREGRGTLAMVEAAGPSPGGTVAKVVGLSRWSRLRGPPRAGLSRRSWDYRDGRGCWPQNGTVKYLAISSHYGRRRVGLHERTRSRMPWRSSTPLAKPLRTSSGGRNSSYLSKMGTSPG